MNMVDENLDIKKINLDSLVPAEYNPRKISDKDYENLKRSIDEFGIVVPIIINLKDFTIISGHQRFDILYYENNLQEVYLLELGDIGWVFTDIDLKIKDKNYEKTLNLALNRIHGEFDPNRVNEILFELEELHLDHLTGFDLELDDIDYNFSSRIDEEYYEDEEEIFEDDYDDIDDYDEEDIIDEDDDFEIEEETEKPSQPKTKERIRRGFIKYGDVYKIGESSYLMFGKENNEQDRTKLLNITPQQNQIEIPQEIKKIKTITKEINYYISDDAELIETFIIKNNDNCKKVK